MAENGPEVSVKISSGPLSQISSAYRLNVTSESPNSQSLSSSTQKKKKKVTNAEAGDVVIIRHLSLKIHDSCTIRGAPCVSRLTNWISTCPQDTFTLPLWKESKDRLS